MKYLTAGQLGISNACYKGLKRIKKELLDGTLKYQKDYVRVTSWHSSFGRMFNMEYWGSIDHCGTPHCIGGWLEVREQLDGRDRERCHDLFYPDLSVAYWAKIRPKHAAEAIQNFLMTGEPQWKEIIK